MLNSAKMKDFVAEMKSRYDYVFDAPPIMGVSDASVLASAVDSRAGCSVPVNTRS